MINLGKIKSSTIIKFILFSLINLFYLNVNADNEANENSDKNKEEIVNVVTQPVYITSFADIIEPLMPSVVNIYTIRHSKTSRRTIIPFENFNNFFEQFNVPFSFEELYSTPRAMSLGSGFIIDESGFIVTNNHVVAGSDEIFVKLFDNTEISAKLIGADPKTDLALLKIKTDKKLSSVAFANSNKSRVGDIVIAIGNPLGFGGTVTQGIISSKGRDLGDSSQELVDDFIQTDAAINVGNSGGPLFNINGQVIGVNTAIPNVGGGNIGIGFAIPSNTVKNIIDQLKEKGRISRGRLDISIQEITKELADALSLKESYGAVVVRVLVGGAGDKAGLKRGDIIVEFNKQKVLNDRKLQLMVAEAKVGTKVLLGVIRNGKHIDLEAEILEYNPYTKAVVGNKISMIVKSGIKFENITLALLNKYNVPPTNKGILVTEIPTSVGNVDLAVGDIVIAIDQQYIYNVEQFGSIYEQIKKDNKNNIILLIKRGGKTMFIALPVK